MKLLKPFKLYFRMLRYRVAIMLLLFFLLGVAFHQKISGFSLDFTFAIIALASSYVAATTINDLADKNIDKVNHPMNRGRPLVTGEATERDLYSTHFLAASIALIAAAPIGFYALGIILISLFINYAYSLSPIKLSHRTHLAPITLSFAYVFMPYWLGVIVAGSQLIKGDLIFLAALSSLFFGRIILKDFRDRKGDKLYGKVTFLLRYGKPITCATSSLAVFLGNLLLFFSLPMKNIFILAMLEMVFVAIFAMSYRLWRVSDYEMEQVAIGIGAKMGNGLLITVLGILILAGYHASIYNSLLFVASITLVFVLNFLTLVFKPQLAVIGYRG